MRCARGWNRCWANRWTTRVRTSAPNNCCAPAWRACAVRRKSSKRTKREAAQAKRERKKPGAALRQTEQHDADTLLRRLFRQLASALHPDRETDPQARLRKTALMSEANAAYEKRDLVTCCRSRAAPNWPTPRRCTSCPMSAWPHSPCC